MKKIGIIYVFLYFIDAVISIQEDSNIVVVSLSNYTTALVSILTIVVFVLSLLGKLKPRKVYLALSTFYLVCSILLGIALALYLPDSFDENSTYQSIHQFLNEQFNWYLFAYYTLYAIWGILAIWGLANFKKLKDA